MDQLRSAVDELVRAGIRSYIGLLGHGERERSRRLFADALALSALVSGGPSARLPQLVAAEPGGPLHGCMVLVTVRSMLATLLVLKTTAFWRKVPVLEELLHCCVRTSECVGTGEWTSAGRDVPARAAGGQLRGGSPSAGHTSGFTAEPLSRACSHETGVTRGCRRNSALPMQPELVFQSGDGQ